MAGRTTERTQQKTARKKRQKTFTGCWTCRERHVKCDEQRPRCRRCLMGDFTCQGYGTRLTWLAPTGQGAPKGGGRGQSRTEMSPLLDISGRPSNRGISPNIDVSLRDSFVASQASSGQQPTPTSRSYTDQRGRAAVATKELASRDIHHAYGALGPETVQDDPVNNMMEPGISFEGVRSGEPSSSFHSDVAHSVREFQDFSPWPAEHTSVWPLNEDQLHSQLYPHLHGGDSFNSWGRRPMSPIGSPMRPFGLPSAPARERDLISHWATNLAHKLIPIRSPVNPFLTVVSPMALAGSRAARTKSTSTVALFHAVCAISAAHQANLRGCPHEDGLMLHHKQLSFHHLMQNINRNEHDEQMATLATLCLWILIHFVTGTPGAWREVVKVTRNLLQGISTDTWSQSSTAALTYQSFSSAFTLIQAQYLGRLEFPAPLKNDLPGAKSTGCQSMPAQSLELVSSFNTKLLQTHILAPDELDQLEIEFVLSTPEPSTDFDVGNADSVMVHHHRSLFYCACLLYFRCNSGRRGPEEGVRDLVTRCLDHMELLELLQKDSSPKTWVYAAVAFEATTPELRDRTRSLFTRRRSLGIATWDTLLLAVEEVWRRRDAALPGSAPEPWTRVLASMPEFDVVLY
ncbi:Putative zn(2)Cys(6) fungal-type DNA-binding domain, fungal transcription factor [Colletotrichum destructivum]|uniref:Zn(2)Cys(6) fungal-type DNA-binding domain, fungal transcription factor n=1 Tax=Colletotrichum destructivum TaxID=34406 RepID=A0AAX4IP08_9PEZI|nr:Putative zn(2)Cys(6) fungal-type DNA-binding domain, fungal transcription factor [Colletotrichum destructivum]